MSHTKCRHHRHEFGPQSTSPFSGSFKPFHISQKNTQHDICCLEAPLHGTPPICTLLCEYVFGKTCIRVVIEKTPSANSTQARLPLVACTFSVPWRCTKHGSFKLSMPPRIKLEWCCHDSIHTCIYLSFAHLLTWVSLQSCQLII